MRNARLWLWGLLPLALLWFATMWFVAPVIEADLTQRVAAAAAAQGQPWAKVRIEGRDATLVAVAPTQDGKGKALAIFADVFGVRAVSAGGEVAPAQQPYAWRAARGIDGIALGGYAPDEATRNALAEAVARLQSGGTPRIDTAIADGAPAGFLNYARFALGLLAHLESGEATLRDTTLSISGRAASAEDAVKLAELLKALPAGLSLGTVAVQPPTVAPYVWSMEKGPGGVALAGFAPDRATAEATRAAVRKQMNGVDAADRQALGSGQPEVYAAAVDLSIRVLAKLAEGKAELRDATLTITGKAATAAELANLRSLLASPTAGLKVVESLTAPEPPPAPPPAPAETRPDAAAATAITARAPEGASATARDCAARVQTAIAGRVVHFERAIRYVREADRPLLHDIGMVLRDCGAVAIGVNGHTDSDGGDAQNRRLSLNRASEVAKALQQAGASASAITVRGLGEDKPVAPNSTSDSKAKNRRVEIVIR